MPAMTPIADLGDLPKPPCHPKTGEEFTLGRIVLSGDYDISDGNVRRVCSVFYGEFVTASGESMQGRYSLLDGRWIWRTWSGK